MIKDDQITSNLFDFYLYIAAYSGFDTGETEGVKWVRSKGNGWPDYNLGGKNLSKRSFSRINDEISDNKLPAFWIRQDTDNSDFDEKASGYGIRKINYWTGMATEMENAKTPLKNRGAEKVSRITKKEEILPWLEVVNEEIISGKKILPVAFINAVGTPEFDFWQITSGQQVISTLLVFKREDVAGLYLVSTAGQFKRKGYGTAIVSSAMNYCYENGVSRFVLHSTVAGIPLYEKMGYKNKCNYGIYWKVGKL